MERSWKNKEIPTTNLNLFTQKRALFIKTKSPVITAVIWKITLPVITVITTRNYRNAITAYNPNSNRRYQPPEVTL